ncbi:MAG: ATP-binding protein, partial [Opitutales bacterium]
EKLDQLETIVNRVLSFARSSETPHREWDLSEVIENTLLLIRLKLEQSKIRLQFSPPASPVIVEGNKGQLEQVFLNLIINAVQAMRDGGDLSIEIAIEKRSGPLSAVVRISDTGCGIPPKLEAKVFEFFLSGNEKGSGLGLAIVRRILDSHRGHVDIERSDSSGTVMKVTLPLAEKKKFGEGFLVLSS